MTSVAPLRSIFHPLAKWTTCLQGTKLTHFFPSLALSVCLYLMYCISVSLPWKLPFPTHVKKKKAPGVISIITSEAFPFTKLQGHPIRFSTSTQDHPSPHSHFPSASPVSVTTEALTSWRHKDPGGNNSQLLQHQNMVSGRNTAASQGPAPGDAHLCSWAARIIPLYRNFFGLHSSSPA